MAWTLDPRARMILSTAFVLSALVGSLIGLTIGLREQPPPNGGSPQGVRQTRDAALPHAPYVDNPVHDDERPRAWVGQGGKAVESEYRTYRYGAVTTETGICSKVGADILGRQLGSAVDAAIASFLCACIVNMHSCGIGGGHFATIYETPAGIPAKIMTTMSARERAPGAAYRDMFVNTTNNEQSVGGLAVAVPGEIHGFYQMWSIYGRMPWRDLFTETIRICEEGFYVENDLAAAINQYNHSIRADPNLAELFVKPDGDLIKAGDLLVNPKLGATMRAIAADPMTFYTGQLAQDIVADLQEYGSIITLEDLANYRSQFKVPINVELSNGGYKLFNPPPPSSGIVLSFILNVLDGYDFTPEDIADMESKTRTYHRIAEAFKFAYAKRSSLGDEDFVDITELKANLTSKDYGEGIRAQIDDARTHDVSYYGPDFDIVPDSGTAHVNVLAPDGGAVALTGTINLFFGAKVRGRRTGIIFNDLMDDFSTPGRINEFGVPASPSNYIEPGKVPMSSMSPTLVQGPNGKVVFLSGAAGGPRITTATAGVIMNGLWFGLDLKKASDSVGRIHHQLLPDNLYYENWLEPEVVQGLASKGHNMTSSTGIAVCGSVHNGCPGADAQPGAPDWCIEALSDGRKGGFPDGF